MSAAGRRLDEVDESGVDRSYFHGTISREVAVERLQERNLDGAFLLRMSATQAGAYTISLQAKGEIKHIRVTHSEDGMYSLGKSKTQYVEIWDLIEAQLDQKLKSTKGDVEVQLIYPLEAETEAIAPDLLARAGEAGMDAGMFDDDVLAFMTGGVSVQELARRRAAQKAAQEGEGDE